MVNVLVDRFGKDIIIAPISATHFKTTVTVAVSGQFFGWIMGIDGDVKIVAPDNIVDQMKEHIRMLQKQYR